MAIKNHYGVPNILGSSAKCIPEVKGLEGYASEHMKSSELKKYTIEHAESIDFDPEGYWVKYDDAISMIQDRNRRLGIAEQQIEQLNEDYEELVRFVAKIRDEATELHRKLEE